MFIQKKIYFTARKLTYNELQIILIIKSKVHSTNKSLENYNENFIQMIISKFYFLILMASCKWYI